MTGEQKAGAGIIGVLVLAIAILGWQVSSAKAAARDAGLRADSVVAANDTTRVAAALRKLYGDSLAGVERRAIQAELSRSSADRLLERIAQANVTMAASIAGLAEHITSTGGTTESPEGVRTATFNVRKEPYTAVATAHLPTPPAAGSLDLNVTLDEARIGVRLQCGVAVNNIRPASVLVTTPPWLRIRLDSVQQSPDVCNPLNPRHDWWSWANIRARLALGPGVACGPGARGGFDCVAGLGGTLDILPRRK